RLPARSRTQGIVDPDESAIERPVVDVAAHGVPVGEVSGQVAPRAAGAGEIKESIDNLSEIDDGGTIYLPLPPHKRSDQLPSACRSARSNSGASCMWQWTSRTF